MMMILSAEEKVTGKISKSTIKKIATTGSGVTISDTAAEAIAVILEKKAEAIAKYAVERAKKKNRKVVLDEDVDSYSIMFGD